MGMLSNKNGEIINPATEDSLVDLLSSIQATDIDLTNISDAIEALNGTGITYSSAVIDVPIGGPTQVLAAPAAGLRHWIYGIIGTAGTADGTILLRDGAATAFSGTMPIAQNGGFVLPVSQNPAIPWFRCGIAQAFQITTTLCTFDGIVVYATR